MKIIIQRHYHPTTGAQIAEQSIDPDDVAMFHHPRTGDKPVSIITMIKLFNVHPELRGPAGLDVVSQHPDESSPKTRWERIVEHTNSVHGHPELKKLKLSAGKERK